MSRGSSDRGGYRPKGTPDGRDGRVRLGPALRQAWVGYQRRLDEDLAAAGFDDRRFPSGRVLRMCADPAEATIAQIGRELGITRQGASKIVANLRDRRYVTVSVSAADSREKLVKLTPLAIDYLAAERKAARAIERRLRAELGDEGFVALYRLLEALGGDEEMRMRDYLRNMRLVGGRGELEE
jgi:DNA-binding MarR family transcriptional regulator